MGSAGLFEVGSNVNSVFGYSRVGSDYPDKKGVRVSVVTYNSIATIRSNLSDFKSADELTSMIYSLKPGDSYDSNLQADSDEPSISQLGDDLKANRVKIVTVADITRNDRQQISKLKSLARNGDGFNINDDYVSEEIQQAMCRANCFCPRMYHQFMANQNGTVHAYDLFSSLASQADPLKYHIGLHFVNNGYFWEQSDGSTNDSTISYCLETSFHSTMYFQLGEYQHNRCDVAQ
ncbi:CRE-CLEC-218 protein [Caenorhabditis remanei]|uniref:CRE-CLEC-218 protein n=1 Tax=Caenorhabditis remanei TaxID=31234 RepID=E3LZQ1_CAERE|nr:CRE-CLEC-218 protein [Caenorhabditis remanei]